MSAQAQDQLITNWPSDKLRYCGSCPACLSTNRQILFSDLTDGVYGVPGRWNLWRCADCEAAYLDPQPSPESILDAYVGYHTQVAVPSRTLLSRIRDRFAAAVRYDYLNAHFGYSLHPSALFLGRYWLGRMPQRALAIRHYIRHLPPPSAPGARLLDIGAGNGAFLRVASELGYCVEGIEPDPIAVEACRSAGFDVRVGALPNSSLKECHYEHIVLSHVVEHLHYPIEAMRDVWRAIKPGGRIWLSTPNLNSAGLRRWGPHWRGLEPPRHLVLYNAHALKRLLQLAGFQRIEVLEPENVRYYLYPGSEKIKKGELFNLQDRIFLTEEQRLIVNIDNDAERKDSSLSEYIHMIAFK